MKATKPHSPMRLAPVTIVMTILTLMALNIGVPIYGNWISNELSPTRSWVRSNQDHKGAAVYQSMLAQRNAQNNRVVLLGNSGMYRAIGDPAMLSNSLREVTKANYDVYNLGTGKQSLIEAAALLENVKPNEKTTIIFGIDELLFKTHNSLKYLYRLGLPWPKTYLSCDEVTCLGEPLIFYVRRIKMYTEKEITHSDFRELCEIENRECIPSTGTRSLKEIAKYKASDAHYATDLRTVISRIQNQSDAEIVFLMTPLNTTLLKQTDNDVFFSQASHIINSIADEFDIPIITSPGRAPDDAKYFKDYIHISNQQFRLEIADHIANALSDIFLNSEQTQF